MCQQFVESLPACPWENGGTVGDGLVHPKDENSMAMSGLGCENPSVGVGEPFLPLILS